MIFDNSLVCTAQAPQGGLPYVTTTTGIDIAPNMARYPLSSLLLEPGGIIARFRVTEAFLSADDAGCQLHVVGSTSATFATGVITLATIAGPVQLFNSGTTVYPAFKVATMALGATFDVPLGPLTASMDTSVGPLSDLRKIQYLGCAVTCQNYLLSTFTAGIVQCSFLLNPSSVEKADRLWPASVTNK